MPRVLTCIKSWRKMKEPAVLGLETPSNLGSWGPGSGFLHDLESILHILLQEHH